jgi:cytochrome bd ubiquinol oxidase subunit II
METLWFAIVALLIAAYVVLDGFDLGAGALHLWLARTAAERRAVLASIGPVWDGNEVCLLAAGGTLYFAFPALYASSFSGFYLPLMVVLWLLILRGIAIEFRNHVASQQWEAFWDTVFSGASMLLAIFFGAALGNVVRGVPLDAAGTFFLPLWTDFRPGRDAGILDWYTVLVALAALLTLAHHGALWIALKTEGTLENRARRAAARLWWGVLVAAIALTWASFRLQPHLAESFGTRPWGYLFPALAVAGLLSMKFLKGLPAFAASCMFIGGMLASAAFGMYPYVLPSIQDPALSLTIHNTAASRYGLGVGLVWFIPGIALAAAYFIYTYRSFAGKVAAADAPPDRNS